MPPVVRDDAWLWRSTTFSDVTLLVYPAGDGPDGAWTSGKPEPLARIPLHASVLASVSPEHYRRHLMRLSEQGASAAAMQHSTAEPQAKRAKVADTEAVGMLLELTCRPGELEAVPEAVLHHAYTGILPDEAHMLAWMMWRADYLDMLATVEACLAKLQAMARSGKLTLQQLAVIDSLPALQTGSRAVAEQQVAQIAAKVLAAQLGVAHRVVVEQQLMDQFVQLPFPLLKQWATLDSVVVDSENTMAVLITAWYDHQLKSAPPATGLFEQLWRIEQHCKELSALICLDKLSPSFHLQALPHLKWYRPPLDLPEQHAVMRVLASINKDVFDSEPDYQAALASGGVARQLKSSRTREWPLSRQQVQQLWADSVLGLDGILYFAGFSFTVQLQLDPSPTDSDPASGPGTGGQQQPAAAAEQQAAGVEQQPAAAPGQQPAGVVPPGFWLCVYIRASWPANLLSHGLGGMVSDPTTAVRVQCQVGDVAVDDRVILLRHKGMRGCELIEQPFSQLEALVAFLSRPFRVTLSSIR